MPFPLPHPSASALISAGVTHAGRECNMVRRMWCGAEWPSDAKRDVGGISWDNRTMAAGEGLGRDLS